MNLNLGINLFFYVILMAIPEILLGDKQGLQEKLNKCVEQYTVKTNLTAGQIYEGQKAGYVTGGGISMRTPVENSKLATINLPKVNAGCGGIDIFAGGASFIRAEEIVQTLKAIATDSAGYAFLLGLETVSPQASNIIKQLQSWSNDVNDININSCEIASTAVGSVWPQKQIRDRHVCRMLGSIGGRFDNFIDSSTECTDERIGKTTDLKSKDSRFKDLLIGDYNIAWEAIQKESFFSNNQELAEMVMSLMGTIVIANDFKDNPSRKIYPSRISDESFLNTLLEGGETKGYSCQKDDKNRCILIHDDKKIIMNESNSWVGKIKDHLLDIQNKILQDEELSFEEQELLHKTTVPIYRFIFAATAYKKGYCAIDIYQLAKAVAFDILIQYLKEIHQRVKMGCEVLKKEQFYDNEVQDYMDSLKEVEKAILYQENRARHLVDIEFQMMQKIEMMEGQIASELVL